MSLRSLTWFSWLFTICSTLQFSLKPFTLLGTLCWGFPGGACGKEPPASAGNVKDTGSIPGLGRSPVETMATHSSIPSWRTPWTKKPDSLQSIGSERVKHDWSDLARMHGVVFQLLSHVQLFLTPWTQHARLPCPLLSLRVLSNSCPLSWWGHPIISSCLPLLLLPSVFPNIRVFSSQLALHIRWPKYYSVSFSISHSNEYSGQFPLGLIGLISIVQGILKSLFQHRISKASILCTQLSLWSNSHIHTWLLEKP